MKKISVSILAVAFTCVSAFAQTKPSSTPPPPPPASNHSAMTAEQRTESAVTRMNKELTLTEDQKPKVKAAILKREKGRDEAREKNKEDKKAFMMAMKKCNEDYDKEINAILTQAQKDKQKQLQDDRMAKAKERQKETKDKQGKTDGVPTPPPPAPSAPTPPSPKK